MTDTRLAESFLTHPTIDGLSDAAHRVYTNGLVYAVAGSTDGRLPQRALRLLHPDGTTKTVVKELVNAGLWTAVGDGFEVRNFLRYQSSAEQVKQAAEARQQQRAADAERKRRQRHKDRVSADVTPDVTPDIRTGSTGRQGQEGQEGSKTGDESNWPTVTEPGTASLCEGCGLPMTVREVGQTRHATCGQAA